MSPRPVIIDVKTETNPYRANMFAEAVLLDLQGKINADTDLTLAEKIRLTLTNTRALAKVRDLAKLERRLAKLEDEWAAGTSNLHAERRALEVERARNEVERAQLDDARAQLNEAWTKLHAERASQSAP